MEKPILFNTEMVQAIQAGRKTQTRRVAFVADALREFSCASYPDGWWYEGRVYKSFKSFVRDRQTPKCKYSPGDILWVRETWQHVYTLDDNDQAINGSGRYIYFADNPMPFDYWVDADTGIHKEQMPWKPSIHMPKKAARIFLRVKDVRVERLQDMRLEDCLAEGVRLTVGVENDLVRAPIRAREWFSQVWDSTIKPAALDMYGWDANPWVWVIEFERCEKPEGWC